MLVQHEHEGGNRLLKMFSASFKSKETARAYDYHLKRYCSDLKIEDPGVLLTMTPRDAEDTLIQFIITKKQAAMSVCTQQLCRSRSQILSD